MDPQEDPAFPILKWLTTLKLIKDSATAWIVELKNRHSGDKEALAKILVCENPLKSTKCWQQYNGKEKKIFFEFYVHSKPSAAPHREHPLHSL